MVASSNASTSYANNIKNTYCIFALKSELSETKNKDIESEEEVSLEDLPLKVKELNVDDIQALCGSGFKNNNI